MEEDRDVLEALAGPDDPVRLWRRAWARLRARVKRKSVRSDQDAKPEVKRHRTSNELLGVRATTSASSR
jgi:hypothetical protein